MAGPKIDGKIDNIRAALKTVRRLEKKFFDAKLWPFHRFPFGLWFRGHCQAGKLLEPRVFRDEAPTGRKGMWDESNVFDHLKLRAPAHHKDYRSAFDWLCLMQHYSVPTRLLDWSESILPALYFAVKDLRYRKKPGELIVLNAKRLNIKSKVSRKGKPRPTISAPDTPEVIVRAEMAVTRSSETLLCKPDVAKALKESPLSNNPEKWLASFTTPIAVFPSRLNDRMIFQASVFTLHGGNGGKRYLKTMKREYEDEIIPQPIGLDELNERCKTNERILLRYEISPKAKETILDDLLVLGIHEGTLFPEIDHQADYLETLWWYKGAKPG